MIDRQKQKITISISGQPPMELKIPREHEYIYREAEKNINELYAILRSKFSIKEKDDQELWSIVAFQFAQLYFFKKRDAAEADLFLKEFEESLDQLLRQVY